MNKIINEKIIKNVDEIVEGDFISIVGTEMIEEQGLPDGRIIGYYEKKVNETFKITFDPLPEGAIFIKSWRKGVIYFKDKEHVKRFVKSTQNEGLNVSLFTLENYNGENHE